MRAGRPPVRTTAPPTSASSTTSPSGYASFVATEIEPPVAASNTGRNANAAPSAVVASAATSTVEPEARVERDDAPADEQGDRHVRAGVQREPERIGGRRRRRRGRARSSARRRRRTRTSRTTCRPRAAARCAARPARTSAGSSSAVAPNAATFVRFKPGELRRRAEDERAEGVHDHERAEAARRSRDPPAAPHHFRFGIRERSRPPPYR